MTVKSIDINNSFISLIFNTEKVLPIDSMQSYQDIVNIIELNGENATIIPDYWCKDFINLIQLNINPNLENLQVGVGSFYNCEELNIFINNFTKLSESSFQNINSCFGTLSNQITIIPNLCFANTFINFNILQDCQIQQNAFLNCVFGNIQICYWVGKILFDFSTFQNATGIIYTNTATFQFWLNQKLLDQDLQNKDYYIINSNKVIIKILGDI